MEILLSFIFCYILPLLVAFLLYFRKGGDILQFFGSFLALCGLCSAVVCGVFGMPFVTKYSAGTPAVEDLHVIALTFFATGAFLFMTGRRYAY